MTQSNLTIEVIKAVAAADGVEQSTVDALHNYIDPDILLELDEQERTEWRFTFQFSDHQVTVTHESQVFVDGVLYSER